MKRTLFFGCLGVTLVALMSACGPGRNQAGIISPTPVANTLTGTFNPNQNMFLNGCPGCQYQNPATSCGGGIYTGSTCITNPQMQNFGQDPMILAMYSNAVNSCGAYGGYGGYGGMQQQFNPYFQSFPNIFSQGCSQFSNFYQYPMFY